MITKKSKSMNLNALNKRLGEMTVGGFLRSWRLSEEMTQKDFADMIGMSSANLCDIEKGRKGVSLEKAKDIADAIGYSPMVLIGLALSEKIKEAGLNYDVEVKPSRKKAS